MHTRGTETALDRLETLYNYARQTTSDLYARASETVNNVVNSAQPLINTCVEGVYDTAKKIQDFAVPIIKGTVYTLLFLSNSSLFVLGAFTAVLAPDFMRGCLGRITSVWNSLDLASKSIVIAGAAIGWPISFAVSAFVVGTHVSLMLQTQAAAAQHASTQ